MSNYKKKEVMDYLTRKPVTSNDFQAAIDISKLRSQTLPQATSIEQPETDYQTEVQPDMVVPPQDVLPKGAEPVMPFAPSIPDPQYRQLELATGGRVKFADAGSVALPINPMLDNVNPNTIGGATIVPAAGITVAAIADKFNISLEKAKELLSTLYTGPSVLKKTIDTPEGKVFAPDEPIPAKPDIEKFPGEGERETTLVTEQPSQTKTNIGLTPPSIDNRLPGFKSDKEVDTSTLYSIPIDPKKIEKVAKAYDELEKELKRIPFVKEVEEKTGMPYYIVKNYLEKANRTLADRSSFSKTYFESLKEIGDVDKPAFSKSGLKWPDQETKTFYENQIINRYKFAKNSSEFRQRKETGELLTNEQLAEKYNISVPVIKRINRQIVENYNLEEKPVKGAEQRIKDRSEKRQEAIRTFSHSNFEQKLKGNLDVNLGHMSDLYTRIVTGQTAGYTPVEINKALADTIDYKIKNIYKAQDKLIKEKPEGWKEDLEKLNVKGMNYAAFTKGYKTFEIVNPDTLERKPFNVQYDKIIDPTGIYVNKQTNKPLSMKEMNEKTNLREINKIERAFTQAFNKEKIKYPELVTEENFQKLIDYKLFEINRKAVLKSQSEIPSSEKENISKDILNFKNFKFNKGGRVHLQNGTDDMYSQEIPSLGLTDPIDILEQQLANEKDTQKILALSYILDETKKRKLQEETKAAEYKKSQKEKGIRYMEDFPSQTDYFAETTKQLFTNPKYFYGKGLKGVTEGTEWLVGQPLQILFNQEGKNWEWYHPQAGEKLGINKYIEKNIPKGATTGTLALGETAEIAGTFMDPFLAYGIVKGAMNTSKLKKPVQLEEKIDPTRRDLLKTGAILTGGAIVYPTAKKLGLLETGVKATKVGNAVRVATHQVVDNMPEFFPYLSELSLKKGKRIGEDYMRSGMTEFKREITIPLELNTIEKGKTNVKFEFVHDPGEGSVYAYYTNPLTDEKHGFEFSTGKQGKQKYGVDPEYPNAFEYYAVEVEPPSFGYKAPNKSDPYRKDFDYYDTATEGDDVIKALDKWYKELPKAEKEKFEKRFITHSEYADEIPAASYTEEENYPIMDFMYPKKKND